MMQEVEAVENWLTLAESRKVELLSRPDIYPDKPGHIVRIETHLSWVFLTDRFAYKLRKPVRYGALDYSTIEARLSDAKEEVRLNRRLAPTLYLGIIPVTKSSERGLMVGGDGEVLEWMIKMRRLPQDGMMDVKIKTRNLTPQDVEQIADCLAVFYKNSRAIPILSREYIARLRSEIALNYNRLSDPILRLPYDLVNSVYMNQLDYLKSSEGTVAQRARAGKVIDGHGDLRPEHICLEENRRPVIFDCLQFDPNLRLVDPVDELSFLSLECERLGAPEVNSLLFDRYFKITGDSASPDLIRFYKSYRAAMWARLAIMRTEEIKAVEWNKWILRANDYLALAGKYSPLRKRKTRSVGIGLDSEI